MKELSALRPINGPDFMARWLALLEQEGRDKAFAILEMEYEQDILARDLSPQYKAILIAGLKQDIEEMRSRDVDFERQRRHHQ